MTSETQPIAAQHTETVFTGRGTESPVGTMAWNRPGISGLWGLATSKDSLKYWLQGKSFSSFVLARWIFAIYLITASLNGFVVFNRLVYSGEATELATHPFVTAIVLVLVLATTKERSQGLYFWAAWGFWITVNLVGFVNATKVNSENFYAVVQSAIKIWINVIGIPWMAFRIISPDKLQRYTNLLVFSSTVGSIMCLVQTAYPELFSYIRAAVSIRGAGTWDGANGAGLALMLALFLTRLSTWRSPWIRWTVYLILLAGLIGTFSRGSLLGYICGEFVYLFTVRNYKRIFITGSFLLMFLASWVVFGFLVEDNTITVKSKEIRDRVQTFSKIISGKGGEDLEKGRLHIWRGALQDVLNEGSLLFGLGHIGMVKSKTTGLAPHNEYIHQFANGGLFGLSLFLAFFSTIAYIFKRCKDRNIRASLLCMIVGFAVYGISADKIFLPQLIGPYLAIFLLWAHYSKDYPGEEKVQQLRKSLVRNLALSNPLPARPA